MKKLIMISVLLVSASSFAANKIQTGEAKALFESGNYCKTQVSKTWLSSRETGPSDPALVTRTEIRLNGLNVCYHEFEKTGENISGGEHITMAYINTTIRLNAFLNANYYCYTYPSESSMPNCED